MEISLLSAAAHASVRRSPRIAYPPAANDERLVEGGRLYKNGCARCHGELEKPFAQDRLHYLPVRQLSLIGTRYDERQTYWIVKHGIRMTAMRQSVRMVARRRGWCSMSSSSLKRPVAVAADNLAWLAD